MIGAFLSVFLLAGLFAALNPTAKVIVLVAALCSLLLNGAIEWQQQRKRIRRMQRARKM